METKSEAKVLEMKSEGAMVRAVPNGPSVAVWQPPEWTEERMELLKRQASAVGATDDEFKFYLAWCKRTGLDPFIKQAYLVERRSRKPNGDWEKKQEPMASEAGMAARADAMPDYRGMRGGPVYEGDEFAINRVTGEVHHISTPLKQGRLVGAWAHAQREGRSVPVTFLRVEERIQTTGEGKPTKFWATMPAGQIAKCARAEQYRLAYPNIFAGVYIAEEIRDEERDVTPPAEQPKSTVSTLAEKVKAKVAQSTPPATPPPPTTVEGPAKVPAFSTHKGKLVAELSLAQLAEVKAEAAAVVKAKPNAPQVAQILAFAASIDVEIEEREAVLKRETEEAREPGAEG